MRTGENARSQLKVPAPSPRTHPSNVMKFRLFVTPVVCAHRSAHGRIAPVAPVARGGAAGSAAASLVLAIAVVLALGLPLPTRAQLAITEIMSSASTNLGPVLVVQPSDFWELTNFGTNTVNLTGYKWNDNSGGLLAADPLPFQGLSIGPNESIIFMESNSVAFTTPEQFRSCWNAPATLQVALYIGNGLSSAGDGVRLWDNADQLVDLIDIGAAERGRSFTYDTATGVFGLLSSNGVAGAFKAITTDDLGSPGLTSGVVPPRILTQPASQKVNPGDTVILTVAAGGMPKPRFQWFYNDSVVVGAVTPSLIIIDVQSNKLGNYRVDVDNGVVSLTSSNAVLSLNPRPEPPSFVTSPKRRNAFLGQSLSLVSLATGTPQPTYQWYLGGVQLSGATNAIHGIPGATDADAGEYVVVAANPLGSATNQAAVVVTRRPRLVITEILPAQSTNGAANGHSDWWELTNLDDFTVDLTGYRWDDSSATLSAAITFTNESLSIAPGESIVFVESMTKESFRSWWGEGNLRADLQIVPYRGAGLGLSTAGDAVNLWNSAATDDADTVASEVYSTASLGLSFGYNPDTGVFGDVSTSGLYGGFGARESGDIGSPGYIRTPINPRVLQFARGPFGWVLTFTTLAGRNYSVQTCPNPSGNSWTTVFSQTAGGETQTFTDTTQSGPGVFYRVVLEQ